MKKLLPLLLSASVALSACQTQGTDNPLLVEWNTPHGIPPFDQIENQHYLPAFHEAMRQHQAEIDAIVNSQDPPSFDNTILAYDQAGELLRKISPVFSNLNSANTNAELQAIARELSPLTTRHYDNIRLNMPLFRRVLEVYNQREQLALSPEQLRLLTETYKGFVRSGAALSADNQQRLRELNTRIAELQTLFGQNMLDETAAYELVIDSESDLDGLSDDLKNAAAERAAKKGLQGKWVFGLDNPSIMPFLESARNREKRQEIMHAYLNRCNNNNDKDNKAVVTELVALRLEKAQLMNATDYAAFVLEDRMAKNADNVYSLLNQIWTPALRAAENEKHDLQQIIRLEGESFSPEAADWRFYAAKAKTQKYNINDDMLRPYFKLENVRDGIFFLSQKLYGITFTELTGVPLPTSEAAAFECKDEDGSLLGILFLDMFSRPGAKNGGAWCSSYRSQGYKNGERIVPLVTIVCNFTRPVGDKPALLSPDETETFFHEFGHALHSLFRNVHYYGVGGVPRDFVELPSQIMEHWVFEPQLLKEYAKHYETGEAIPLGLVEKLRRAGKYGQGFATIEYLAAAYLDMDYHVLRSVANDLDIPQFESTMLNAQRGLMPQIPPRYRTTYFRHTMAGGYTAGYYSYIWAEVLDCDAFMAFKETGNIFNKTVAAKFRKEILERGGQDDAMTLYMNFRGQQPSVQGLLENRGLN
jgi:peptidyl-dipeptidase Dcp